MRVLGAHVRQGEGDALELWRRFPFLAAASVCLSHTQNDIKQNVSVCCVSAHTHTHTDYVLLDVCVYVCPYYMCV